MKKKSEVGIPKPRAAMDRDVPGEPGGLGTAILSKRGIALLMVLWVLVMLSIIALSYLKSSRWNSASTRNLRDETVEYYMALSGYQEAVNYLVSDKDQSYDFTDADGNFWVDDKTPTVTGKRETAEGEVTISIVDEDSKININKILEDPTAQDRVYKIMMFAGIPQEEWEEIRDSMLDWLDPDNDTHLNGAEDDYYDGLDAPYKSKNGAFDLPEELVLVKGMKREYLYGMEQGKGEVKAEVRGEGKEAPKEEPKAEARGLLPFITTFGTGALNINTVSKEVLEALGVDPVAIEAIMKQRTKEIGGFRSLEGYADFGFTSVTATVLRIEVTARANNSPVASKIVAVVKRQSSLKGMKIQTIYWRESAESVKTQENISG